MSGSSSTDAPTKVYFCRHGETDWNLAKRFQGSHDIPLNAAGGQQALQLAEALAARSVKTVWTSPLVRARDTGLQIAIAARTPFKVDERLIERGLGVMQGLTSGEVRRDFPKIWASWKIQGPFPEEAEVELDVAVIARVESALFELAEQYPGQSVAIIGHGAAMRSVLMRPVGTASITELSVGPGRSWSVVKIGDERHLSGLRGLGYYADADASEWGEDMSEKTTTVLLCRHGETDWNLGRKFQGTVDIPLNDLGRKQAQHISKALESKNVAAVWTSPMQRAFQTGQIVTEGLGVKLQLDDRLRERNLGVMQGLNPTQLREQFPTVIDAWIEQIPLPPEAHAESSGEVVSRIESALFEMAAAYPGQTVALILHGASIRCLLKRAVGNSRIKTPKNVSLTTMVVGPGRTWRLTRVADASHMPKPTKEELLHKMRTLSKL